MIKSLAQANTSSMLRMPAKRFMMGLAITALIALIWWFLNSRLSLMDQTQSQIHENFSLSHDIAALRTQWSKEKAAVIEEKASRAEDMLLDGLDHLTVWLHELDQRASQLGLHTKYQVGSLRPRPENLDSVGIVPVDLVVSAMKQGTPGNRTYEQYIQFLQTLAEDRIRADINQATVHGGRGAEQMTLLLHVWMKVTA